MRRAATATKRPCVRVATATKPPPLARRSGMPRVADAGPRDVSVVVAFVVCVVGWMR